MELSQDAVYVIESYKAHFLGRNNVVLYGVGTNTKAILNEVQDPNIVGLMDPLCEGSSIMGKPVLSVQEASEQAGLIVIIARPSVVPVIFERIRDLESSCHIPIYSIEGKRLIEEEGSHFSSDIPYWSCCSDELKHKIASAEVISFDIFDTLLVRDVLRPVDLFFFLERRLQYAGIPCQAFALQRQAAEAQLNQFCVPRLEQIYELLKEYYGWTEKEKKMSSAFEWELEQQACHARQYMRELYRYALRLQKTVVLVSDMYLSKMHIQSLLERAGYTGHQRLYVSCEHQATKASGALFDLVRRDFQGPILHIGDNPHADGTMAQAHGFHIYPILSVYDMLLHSSIGQLVAKAKTPDTMLTLGMIARKLFDDPFALGPTKGVISVDNLHQMGFAFVGPIVSCFVRWMCQEVWDKDYEMLLFSARDGYVIKKLYQKRWTRHREHLPKGVYFRTSRRVITVAALRDESDFDEIMRKPYKTLKGQLLLKRFGIRADSTDAEAMDSAISTQNGAEVTQYILKYKNVILQNAEYERGNYLRYMEEIGLAKARRVLLYDFCSGGTIQHHLSKLLGPNIQVHGIYFATMDWFSTPYHQKYSVHTMFGNVVQYSSGYFTTRHYMFLEAVLLEHCDTCLYCRDDGTFVYAQGENRARNIQKLTEIQSGILAFDHAIRRWEDVLHPAGDEDRDFADEVFGVLFSKACKRSPTVQTSVSVDNGYDFDQPYYILRDRTAE